MRYEETLRQRVRSMEEGATYTIERYINRNDIEVPETFVPAARHFVIGTEFLRVILMAIHNSSGGWHDLSRGRKEQFARPCKDGVLWVTKCMWEELLYSIRRSPSLTLKDPHGVLAFSFDPHEGYEGMVLPILIRDYKLAQVFAKAAFKLAERARAVGITWVQNYHETASENLKLSNQSILCIRNPINL
jgi:hypothetical protein